jgi:hypothetical protein
LKISSTVFKVFLYAKFKFLQIKKIQVLLYLYLRNLIGLITCLGASSGIGRSTAILFSKLGSKLTLVGRDEKALDETIASCENASKNEVN